MRGGRKTGGWGHATGGGVIFEGQARGGVCPSLGRSEGVGRECPSTSLRKEGERRKEEEEGGKRSRALSCRPGSQIRSGLKRGVDCV